MSANSIHTHCRPCPKRLASAEDTIVIAIDKSRANLAINDDRTCIDKRLDAIHWMLTLSLAISVVILGLVATAL